MPATPAELQTLLDAKAAKDAADAAHAAAVQAILAKADAELSEGDVAPLVTVAVPAVRKLGGKAEIVDLQPFVVG